MATLTINKVNDAGFGPFLPIQDENGHGVDVYFDAGGKIVEIQDWDGAGLLAHDGATKQQVRDMFRQWADGDGAKYIAGMTETADDLDEELNVFGRRIYGEHWVGDGGSARLDRSDIPDTLWNRILAGPTNWTARVDGGNGGTEFFVGSMDEAMASAEAWAKDGDYDEILLKRDSIQIEVRLTHALIQDADLRRESRIDFKVVDLVVGRAAGRDGVRFKCASEDVADEIREAYEQDEETYERVVARLCGAGKAEFIG